MFMVSHPKRLMNERRLSPMFCWFGNIALDLTNEPMSLPVERSKLLGQPWYDSDALLVGVRSAPVVGYHYLAIHTCNGSRSKPAVLAISAIFDSD